LHFVLFLPSTAIETFIHRAADLWDFRHQTFWLERELETDIKLVWQDINSVKATLRINHKSTEQIQHRQNETNRLVENSKNTTDKSLSYLNLAKWLLNADETQKAIDAAYDGIHSLAGQVTGLLAKLEAVLGLAHTRLSQFSDAITHHRRSLSVSNQIGDRALEAQTLDNIAQVYVALDDNKSTLRYFNLALTKANEQHHLTVKTQITLHIAQWFIAQAEYDTALYYLDQAKTLAQDNSDRAVEGLVINAVAQSYYGKNQLNSTVDHLTDGLSLLDEIDDTAAQGVICYNLAGVYRVKGEYDRALQYFNSALTIANEMGHQSQASNILWQIASIYTVKGDEDNYLAKIKQSQRLGRQSLLIDDLNALVKQRQQRAVVDLAWRELLRIITLLGRNPLTHLWTQQPIKHCYKLIRVIVLLYRLIFKKGLKSTKIVLTTQRELLDAVSEMLTTTQDASVHAIAKAIAAILMISEGDVSGGYRLLIDSIIFSHDVALDYQWLISPQNALVNIKKAPLWHDGQTTPIASLESDLLADLKAMELDFLAADLQQLWASQPLPRDGEYYQQHFAESELQNPKALRNALLGAEDLAGDYALRVMLLGPVGVGKTALSQLLARGRANSKRLPTVGVHYQNHQPLDLSIHRALITDQQTAAKLEQLQLHLWDFAAHTMLYGLNQLLMDENNIYIVVIDNRHEEAPEVWLYQIQQLTNNMATVFIVTNCFNGIITLGQNRIGLIRKFPQLLNENSFFDFNCSDSAGPEFTAFINQLVQQGFHNRRRVFSSTQAAMKLIKQQFALQHFIAVTALKDLLMTAIDGIDSRDVKMLLHKLSEFGCILLMKNSLQSIAIDPEWLIDTLYNLLNSKQIQDMKGIVDLRTIQQTLNTNINAKTKDSAKQLTPMILDFMLTHQLCAEVKVPDSADQQYFIPTVMPINEPAALSKILNAANRIVMAYECPYIPMILPARVITALLADKAVMINLQNEIWREGVIVRSVSGDNCVAVEYLTRFKRIQLTATGDSATVLAGIIDSVDVAMERVASRQVLGRLIYLGSQKNEVQGSWIPLTTGTAIKPNDITALLESLIDSGVDLIVQQAANAAIGAAAKSQSDNAHLFNSLPVTLSSSQKANIRQVIDNSLKQAVTSGCSAGQLQLLVNVKSVMETIDAALPVVSEPTGNAILQTIYQSLKELDGTVGAAERDNKYFAPLVASVMTTLSDH
jgi:tetratricopeptide (TPR) repeat protein